VAEDGLGRFQSFLKANHTRCWCRGNVLLGVETIFDVRKGSAWTQPLTSHS